QAVNFDSKGSQVAASDSSGRTQSWDLRTGRLVQSDYKGYEGAVSTLAFIENDEYLAVVGDTRAEEEPQLIRKGAGRPYQVWHAKTGKALSAEEAEKKVETL